MTEHTAIDTNILAYAEGLNGSDQRFVARSTLARLDPGTAVLPVQVLGELFNVLTRKAKRPAAEAQETVLRWSAACLTIETSFPVFSAALELSRRHQFSIWDAIIVAAADHGGCRTLLSADMQHGFTWRGVTIRNPFLQA